MKIVVFKLNSAFNENVTTFCHILGCYWSLHPRCIGMFEDGSYLRRRKRFKADDSTVPGSNLHKYIAIRGPNQPIEDNMQTVDKRQDVSSSINPQSKPMVPSIDITDTLNTVDARSPLISNAPGSADCSSNYRLFSIDNIISSSNQIASLNAASFQQLPQVPKGTTDVLPLNSASTLTPNKFPANVGPMAFNQLTSYPFRSTVTPDKNALSGNNNLSNCPESNFPSQLLDQRQKLLMQKVANEQSSFTSSLSAGSNSSVTTGLNFNMFNPHNIIKSEATRTLPSISTNIDPRLLPGSQLEETLQIQLNKPNNCLPNGTNIFDWNKQNLPVAFPGPSSLTSSSFPGPSSFTSTSSFPESSSSLMSPSFPGTSSLTSSVTDATAAAVAAATSRIRSMNNLSNSPQLIVNNGLPIAGSTVAVIPNAIEPTGNEAQKLLYQYGNYSPVPNMLTNSSALVPRYNIPPSPSAFPPNVTITSMQGIPRYNPYSLINSHQSSTQIPSYSYYPFSSLSQKFCLPTI